MIEADVDDLFEEGEDGSIHVSDTAPSVLRDAISEARKNLSDQDEYVLRAVGEPRRALDFGLEDLITLQTETATIFTGKHPKVGPKILAVGVSKSGYLTQTQVQEALEALGAEAELLPEEMAKSVDTAGALQSIKQAKYIVTYNADSLFDEISNLKQAIRKQNKDVDDITSQLNIVEVEFHNLLSAVYTFSETIEESLREIDVIRTSKHHVQKYEDAVSVAIGLRHYIQHRSTFSLRWITNYNHDKSKFEYEIGILTSEVCEPEFYHGTPTDAAGNKYEPLEYYYEDVSSYLINIEEVSGNILNATDTTYDDLKNDLQESHIEGVEIANQFWRMKKYGLSEIIG